MPGIDWPDSFYPLPGVPGAVARGEARPCRCGAWDFLVVLTASGQPSCQCPKCCKLKAGDRVLGVLDRRRWEFRGNARERHA